jgi:hypothetical protein
MSIDMHGTEKGATTSWMREKQKAAGRAAGGGERWSPCGAAAAFPEPAVAAGTLLLQRPPR